MSSPASSTSSASSASSVSDALAAYTAARATVQEAKTRAKELSEGLADAHDELLAAMKTHGVDQLELDDGKVIEIQEKLREFKPRRRPAAE